MRMGSKLRIKTSMAADSTGLYQVNVDVDVDELFFFASKACTPAASSCSSLLSLTSQESRSLALSSSSSPSPAWPLASASIGAASEAGCCDSLHRKQETFTNELRPSYTAISLFSRLLWLT